jgi:hypothetical protein
LTTSHEVYRAVYDHQVGAAGLCHRITGIAVAVTVAVDDGDVIDNRSHTLEVDPADVLPPGIALQVVGVDGHPANCAILPVCCFSCARAIVGL